MASVWKRLQRVNKRAAKFQFTVSYHQLSIEVTPKWVPNKLCVVWTRKSRRVSSQLVTWEPSLQQPLKGLVVWTVPDNQQITVTLFKDPRTNELEDKDWMFVVEDVSAMGKRRQIAVKSLNMKKYATLEPAQQSLQLEFKPVTKKIVSVKLECTLSCTFLKEGKATDEDMQSLASLISENNNSDIAPLDDLEEEEDNSESLKEKVLDFTQKIDMMTNSLSGSDFPSTTLSPASPASSQCEEKPTNSGDASEAPAKRPTNFSPPLASDFDQSDVDPYSDLCSKQLESLSDVDAVDDNAKDVSACFQTPITNFSVSTGDAANINTPGQDLLDWAKDITKNYASVRITNLTTSWRNGVAFCAIIHRFRPDLINFAALQQHDVKQNCKTAFDAGEKLGIPKVIEPSDMDMLAVPDKLAVITYLHQLRAYFTGNELKVERLGRTVEESSYKIGRFHTDLDSNVTEQVFEKEILNARNQKFGQEKRIKIHAKSPPATAKEKSPTITKDIKEIFATKPKNIIGRVLSPTKDKSPEKVENKKAPLMTRRELTDPFGSDEEEEANGEIKKPETVGPVEVKEGRDDPDITAIQQHILNRHDELRQRAKQLIQQSQKYLANASLPDKQMSEEARQAQLKERARKLLANVRRGSGSKSPESVSSPEDKASMEAGSVLGLKPSPDVNGVMQLNGDLDQEGTSLWISKELESLEREQNAIDEHAAKLEGQLRTVMNSNMDPDQEDALMFDWFMLVNKKNALLRRQMQLNILEKQNDLERKKEELNEELRAILALEDWEKTEEQKKRENALLSELLQIVNKRDELVQHLDTQEKAIEDDDLIQNDLYHMDLQQKQNCSIQ